MAYDVFLSYNSLDRPFVSRVAEELEKREVSCFIDQSYLLPGRDWVAGLEKALADSQSVAVFLGPHEMGRWQQRERAWALDRNANAPSFPVIPVLLPGCEPPLGFLRQLTWIDLRQDPPDARQLDALAAAIRGEHVTEDGRREPRATICPYRGLLYFREEDAAFFFGRAKYIDKLVEKVEQRSLVAVVGASGSGKSSVVRAGLVPRLRSRDRSPVWDIVTMVPGETPLHSLAAVMLPLVEPELSGYDLIRKRNLVADDLSEAKTPLWDLVAEALRQQQGTERLLLVVDQWEELYTQCDSADARRRFIDELLDATARNGSPLSVVLTVRSDFYDHILQDRALLDRLEDGKLDLGPMTAEELRTAIENPADHVGLTFQDGLVDRLLADARDEPGRLPLLEFALEELWKRHDSGQLTHAAYETLGRLSGAIATRAEVVYAALDDAEKAAAPGLFRRLVRAGSKTEEDTRRRADLNSLDETPQRVARRLADERLLVTTREGATDTKESAGPPAGDAGVDEVARKPEQVNSADAKESVEVAHEELLRRWDRLKQWINQDRQFLQWRSRLGPALEQYQRDPKSALLRHGALREARQFCPSRDDELEDDERAFVSASFHAERQRKIGLSSGLVATAVAAIVVILGIRVYLQQQANRETVAAAVKNLPSAAAVDVPEVLENLHLAPEYARERLREAFANENDDHNKLRLACGLAKIDAVPSSNHELASFLFGQIPKARTAESANLVRALSRISDQKGVIDKLIYGARATDDAAIRTRYLATALSLGSIEPVATALELKHPPQERTDFIHNLHAWPGDLVRLAGVLRDQDDPDLRSGVCAGLGYLDVNSHSREEREAIMEVIESLYRDARDGGTHNAAGWTLRRWQVDRPPIDPCATLAEIKTWTTKRDWYRNSVDMTMLKIPGGEFTMGSPIDDDEKPPHRVKISEFWLSDREVTVGQFQAVMGKNDTDEVQLEVGEEELELPVTYVTWWDAVKFCNALSKREGFSSTYYDLTRDVENRVVGAEIAEPRGEGYRLATEAEWEYACRAKSRSHFCYGDDDLNSPRLLREYAVFDARGFAACGGRLPNGWGLFDMHGNVYEWCWDWYQENYYAELEKTSKQDGETASDPQGPTEASSRVFRGGSWAYGARVCRAAYRLGRGPQGRDDSLGFRVAAVPPSKSSQEPANK